MLAMVELKRRTHLSTFSYLGRTFARNVPTGTGQRSRVIGLTLVLLLLRPCWQKFRGELVWRRACKVGKSTHGEIWRGGRTP